MLRALDNTEILPLESVEPFDGTGIYALYYEGGFQPYHLLAQANREQRGSWPIYVGKAEGQSAVALQENCRASISAACNLNAEDFSVRVLKVAPTWVPLAESVAMRMHRPVWNTLVEGFGNQEPGAGHRAGEKSRWDTLHPGRAWAELCSPNTESAEQIAQDVRDYLRAQKRG